MTSRAEEVMANPFIPQTPRRETDLFASEKKEVRDSMLKHPEFFVLSCLFVFCFILCIIFKFFFLFWEVGVWGWFSSPVICKILWKC